MKKILINLVVLLVAGATAFAGNPDRRGEAGAFELNMNGYARSSGLWNMNVAGIKGLESERLNPAGLAYTRKTEVIATYTSWLTGSNVNIIQAGIAQRIKSHAIALSINSLNFGSFDRTTTDNPQGDGSTFKPSFFNISLSYAKNFSLGTTAVTGANYITGGVALRLVTEGITSVSATGFSFDAGLQYTTGKKENVHFGVSLRNIGTPMKFGGDGMSYQGTAPSGDYAYTYDKKSNKFELPTQLNVGISYDIYMGAKKEVEGSGGSKFKQDYRITPMFQFTANAFGNDHYGLGVEISIKEIFMLRTAYRFENDIFNAEKRSTAYNGLAAGTSVNIPFKKDGTGPSLGIDYAFRMTAGNVNFKHTHTVGMRFNLGGVDKEMEVKEKKKAAEGDAYEEAKTEKVVTASITKKGKKGKVTIEELEAKQAEFDSMVKVAAALKVKAETPVVKIDTVTVTKTEIVVQKDTILIPTILEKSDYKGGDIDTLTKDGKQVLQFNDYEALEFEIGSNKIQAKSFGYLNYLINILKKNPSYKLSLGGHTDNVGDEEKNQKLSQDRVESVKTYIVGKGVAASRITTEGFGSKKPKYKNDSAAGRAKNRRVEIFMEM